MTRFLILALLLANTIQGQVPALTTGNPYAITNDSMQTQPVPVSRAKQLIKTGVGLPLFRQSSVAPAWTTLALHFMLERRIGTALTLIGGIETDYGFSPGGQLFSVELPIGLRHYFSLGKRMNKRADPHSLFSYYVGLQTQNGLFTNVYYDTPARYSTQNYYRGQLLNYNTNIGVLNESFNFLDYAYFQVGRQIKLSNNRFLDINVVIPITPLIYTKYESTIATPAVVNIRYGLFWQK